jgi:hypothetical protein
MEGKAKFLAPKHVGYWKYKVLMLEIDVSFYDFKKDFVHAKNERAFTIHDHLFVLDFLLANVPIEHKWKYVQFVIIYELLTHGCSMINHKNLKPLFKLLKVKSFSIKWVDSLGWGTEKIMHYVL